MPLCDIVLSVAKSFNSWSCFSPTSNP